MFARSLMDKNKSIIVQIKMAIIYQITNKIDGKFYVGKTTRTLEVRWQGHLGCARRKDTDMLISRAIHKYGSDNFERKIIEECSDETVSAREVFWINELKSHVSQGGYNLTLGGDGGILGFKFSEESKDKIRQKATGRKHSKETLEKMSKAKLGKKQPAELIAKRRLKLIGKKRTEEQKNRQKAAQLARNYHHTDEAKAKLSIASKNRVVTTETREKLRKANKGKSVHTEQSKKKISAANSKAVSLFTVDGVLVKQFNSLKEASHDMSVPVLTIQRSIKLNRPTKMNQVWKLTENEANR